MTKIFNKKGLAVLLVFVLSFCWLIVPASAADVENEICKTDDVSSRWGGTVDELLFQEMYVYAFGGYNLKGEPIGYTINDSYGYGSGPSGGMFCYLPDEFYQGMINLGYDQFLCYLTFSLEGTQLTSYELLLDDQVVYTATKNLEGEHTICWVGPRKPNTEFGIKAYTESGLKATIWGRMLLH